MTLILLMLLHLFVRTLHGGQEGRGGGRLIVLSRPGGHGAGGKQGQSSRVTNCDVAR